MNTQSVLSVSKKLLRVFVNFLMITVLFVLYCVFGATIALPYTYLAKGTLNNFLETTLISPLCVAIIALGYIADAAAKPRTFRWIDWFGGCCTWFLITFFCLPIICTGISKFLANTGFEEAGDLFFKHRYNTIVAGIFILFLMFVVAAIVENLKEYREKKIMQQRFI